MADWDTAKYDYQNQCNSHSRQSSQSSGHSSSNKENSALDSESNQDNSSQRELILKGGNELHEESKTDMSHYAYSNWGLTKTAPEIPSRQIGTQGSGGGTAKARAAKSPYTSPGVDSIPEEEITIPNDANISSFSCDQLANFLKCLKIDDRIVSHLYRKSVDGKRFARLKDSELESLSMKNPVVLFFRDRSHVKTKRKGPYML